MGAIDGEQRHCHAVEQGFGEEQQRPDGEVVGADGVPRIGATHAHQQGAGDHLDRDAQRPAAEGDHEQVDEQVAGHPGPAGQKQQPSGGHGQGDADQRLPADVGELDDIEVAEHQQCQAGSEQGEAPPQQQGQAGETEKMHLQPLVQAGTQDPEWYQRYGAAKAEVLIEWLGKQGSQQGAAQAEYKQQ